MAWLILLYVNLWVLEGALRKWAPGTENAMYLARDAVLLGGVLVISLLYPTKRGRLVGVAFWMTVLLFATFVGIQTLALAPPTAVPLAGLRNYLAPLVLPYLAYRFRPPGLVKRISKVLLIYAPLQAALVIAQVLSPKESRINAIVGGEEASFTTSDGVVRAAGTFTAPIGLSVFSTLVLAVSLIAIIQNVDKRSTRLGYLGMYSAVVMIALSGARSAILSGSIVAVVAVLQLLFARGLGRRFGPSVGLALGITLALAAAVVLLPQVIGAFGQRIERAEASEDVLGRLWQGTIGFLNVDILPLGSGAGGHSAFGISLGSPLRWIEDDSARWVYELGLLGFTLAVLRLTLGFVLASTLVLRFTTIGPAKAVLLSALIPVLLFGSITSLPTMHGFFAIVSAMLVVDLRRTEVEDDTGPEPYDSRAQGELTRPKLGGEVTDAH